MDAGAVARKALDMLLHHAAHSAYLPSTPTVPTYDSHIHAIESLISSLVHQAADHLSTLKHSRNTLIPIHTLPTELLLEIWLTLLTSTPEPDRALHTLALVCRAWHTAVLTHPPLWCFLQDSCSSEWYNDWALHKSRKYPLHIRLASNNPYTAETLVRMALSESSRWKSFTLERAGDWHPTGHVRLDALSTLPSLDSLTTLELHGSWSQAALVLPPTPALLSLHLEDISLDWASLRAPNLRSLRLSAHQKPLPSTQTLLTALRTTPTLQILLVKNTDTPAKAHQPPTEPVNLPALHTLYLAAPNTQYTSELLQNLRADNLERVCLRRVPFSLFLAPPPVLQSLPHPPNSQIEMSSSSSIRLTSAPSPFAHSKWPYPSHDLTTRGFAIQTEQLAITPTLQAANATDRFLDIARFLTLTHPHSPIKLTLLAPHYIHTPISPSILTYLPTLTTLAIRLRLDVSELFHALGQKFVDHDGWPWPNLVELDLELAAAVSAQSLLELARSRWGGSESESETARTQRPAKLRKLVHRPGLFTPAEEQLINTLVLESPPSAQ